MTGANTEVELEKIPHPLADRIREGYVHVETRAPALYLGAAQADLLVQCEGQGQRVVFVTDEQTGITQPLLHALRERRGAWVVRAFDGSLRDGLTGRRLSAIADAIDGGRVGSIDDVAVAFLRTHQLDQVEIILSASVRHKADTSAKLGGMAELMSLKLHGEPPAAWDVLEPVGEEWDRSAMTELARKRMPRDTRFIVRGRAGRPAISTVQLSRTKHGLEETTRAFALVGRYGSTTATNAVEAIPGLLTALSDTGMPLVCLALARPRRANQLEYPFLSAPPRPLALLVGPPGVRALGIDVERAVREQAAVVVGRPRIPGLLFRLGGLDDPGDDRLRAVLESFDPARLNEAIGGEIPLYRGGEDEHRQ